MNGNVVKTALRHFQFRHVSGLVTVAPGDELPDDHPAVLHKPHWFTTPDMPALRDPEVDDVVDVTVDGDDDTPDGEE